MGFTSNAEHQQPPGPLPPRLRCRFLCRRRVPVRTEAYSVRTAKVVAGDKSCVCIPFGEGGYSVTPTPVAGSRAVSTVEFVRDLVRGRQACAGRQWLTDGQVRGVALPA